MAAPALSRWGRRLALVVVVAVGLIGAVMAWLSTDSGRGFVLAQLLRLDFQSGLEVEAERIDGSLWSQATIHGLALKDPQGRFLEAPRLRLDWRPWRFFLNRQLVIRELAAGDVRLIRLPALKPRQDDRLLPDFDILIGKLATDRLVHEPAVTGRRERLSLAGDADIRAGRVRLVFIANSLGGGDRLDLRLDAEPDRDRLDLAADLDTPVGGIVSRLIGSKAPVTARIRGTGSWQRWTGRLDARLGAAPLAALAISNAKGLFRINGTAEPAPLLTGVAARLAGPVLTIDASASLGGPSRDVTLSAASDALRFAARGRVSAATETIETGSLSASLLMPTALNPKISGEAIRLDARLAGTLGAPLVDWTLTGSSAGWGNTELRDMRGAGIVRLGRADENGLALPFRLSADRVVGVGEMVAPLLRKVQLEGTLRWQPGLVTADALKFRTSGLNGTAGLRWPLADADYRLTLKVSAPRYAIASLGQANISADLLVQPSGAGAQISGRTEARMTRLDNDGLTSLFGGLPRVSARLLVLPDLAFTLTDLVLTAPDLTLRGSGRRSPAGIIALDASGEARAVGPVRVILAGAIDAPDIRVMLARPGLGIGLAAVDAHIVPAEAGWGFDLSGTSLYGPVTARGAALTAAGPLGVRIDSATILGLTASGVATATAAGPFAGELALRGPGLEGALVLANEDGLQRLDVSATARESTLPTTTPVLIEAGSLRLSAVLRPEGPDVNGSLSFTGFERDTLRVDTGKATLRYARGSGNASISASGTTGIPFSIESQISLAPERIEVRGKGQVDRQQFTLGSPAIITRDGNDWVLAPVSLVAGAGKAELAGRIGDTTQLSARVEALSLGLIAAAYPRFDVSGTLSGRIDLTLPPQGTPRGRANLTIYNLSRTGIASASLPINVGITADLGARGTVARATIQRGGRTEGRAQIQIDPVAPGDEPLMARLQAARVRGLARFNGPAQALWGLAGNAAIDVRGPVNAAVDISGALGDPQLAGTLRAARARMEATVLGAVIEDIALDARFVGSRLELTRFSGRVGKDGSVSGSGGIDLSADRSFPMDIRLQLKNAQLLNRDDLVGAGTGTIRIATDEYGGVISGKLTIDRATFRIGRAGVADVPVLNVTEKNVRVLGRPQFIYAAPTRWLLNLEVAGDRRLFVSGMGIESEWRANLKILGGATTPELNGRVELVRGDYDFAGRRFALTKGDIRFQGGYPPDPLVDVAAESTNSGFTAQLTINGTALKPNIRFSSVPSLPEDEVLSRLLFGDSVTNLSAPEAVQLAGALAGLRGNGGFNPINSVRKGLGIDRLRILPADIATGRGTAVAAGQYIGRNVYVELATDAQGYTATNIEVSITRSLSILSQVATLGGTGGNLRWKRDY
ncbi:translocation/assembly module TamB domain-containing protein [Polymorphobacter sp.]|uniref:translocation/assembly module TamB domain-containing protein n=1 Tax=Polymorphobacter sp. TaxID=1909290 RepID=UPI003F714AEA